jgi:hypothetical protein
MIGTVSKYNRMIEEEDFSRMFVWYHKGTEKFVVSLFRHPITKDWFEKVNEEYFFNFITFMQGIKR